MTTCPKCGSELMTLVRLGAIATLTCAPCGLRIAGVIEHDYLIPFHDNVPILPLTGGAIYVLDPVG